ncbi:hypothetical protein KIPB_012471 [Kipferlia bialata]|uniref:Uncharacterized protein n=1 Tax=Kipferlia bialata TaxID=797122 RepID=A0A9K3D9I3_9EUKA|nr:hypothetical protein KIPB_012471 [Kipferlia bialata]|eukprot:g12471.t1
MGKVRSCVFYLVQLCLIASVVVLGLLHVQGRQGVDRALEGALSSIRAEAQEARKSVSARANQVVEEMVEEVEAAVYDVKDEVETAVYADGVGAYSRLQNKFEMYMAEVIYQGRAVGEMVEAVIDESLRALVEEVVEEHMDQ